MKKLTVIALGLLVATGSALAGMSRPRRKAKPRPAASVVASRPLTQHTLDLSALFASREAVVPTATLALATDAAVAPALLRPHNLARVFPDHGLIGSIDPLMAAFRPEPSDLERLLAAHGETTASRILEESTLYVC